MDQNGQTRLVKPQQISMRRDSNRAIAVDSEGHEIRIHDNMKEVDGEVSHPAVCSLFASYLILVTFLEPDRPSTAHPSIILRVPPQQRNRC